MERKCHSLLSFNYMVLFLTIIIISDRFHDILAQTDYDDKDPDDIELANLTNANLKIVNKEKFYAKKIKSSISFTCSVNKEYVLAEYDIDWLHIREWNGVMTERLLTKNERLQEDASPEFYRIETYDIKKNKETISYFKLTLLSVRQVDDGKFVCNVVGEQDKSKKSDEVKLVVLKDIDHLKLRFSDFPPISRDLNEPLEVDVGKVYPISCLAEGSNPGISNIKIFLMDNEITNVSDTRIVPMSSDFKQYKCYIGPVNLFITTKHDGQNVVCTAVSPLNHRNSVKIKLKVKVYDPIIECDRAEVSVGDELETTCSINHTGIDIKRLAFRVGDQGKMIYVDEEKTLDGETIKVVQSYSSEDVDNITMIISKTLKSHILQKFDVVVESVGEHITEKGIEISEIKFDPSIDDNDSSGEKTTITASLSIVALFLFIALLCCYNNKS